MVIHTAVAVDDVDHVVADIDVVDGVVLRVAVLAVAKDNDVADTDDVAAVVDIALVQVVVAVDHVVGAGHADLADSAAVVADHVEHAGAVDDVPVAGGEPVHADHVAQVAADNVVDAVQVETAGTVDAAALAEQKVDADADYAAQEDDVERTEHAEQEAVVHVELEEVPEHKQLVEEDNDDTGRIQF